MSNEAEINFQNSLAIMREISRIQFLENFRKMAPDIVKELQKYGVKFPKPKGGER